MATRYRPLVFVIFGMSMASLMTASAAGVAVVAYRSLRSDRPGAARSPAWVTHHDRSGFRAELPPDWAVNPDASSGRITFSGPAGERLVAWPMFSTRPLDARTGGLLAARMATRVWPEVSWARPEPAGEHAVRVEGRQADRGAACVVAWTRSGRGSPVFTYALSAPRARSRDAEKVFSRILASLRLSGAAASSSAPAAPPVRYDTFTDPAERAFFVELPRGWLAEGGTVRPGNLLVQARLEATSPGRASALYVGDAFPVYAEPHATLRLAGIGPGGSFVDPMGYRTQVAPYQPGAAFAVRHVLPERVGPFRVVRQAQRPDVARRLASTGINRYDAGEVHYRFRRGGREHRGWALSITERVATPAVTLWHAWRLYLVEAEEARFEEAAAALGRAAGTFRIDPAWAERQARLTAAQVGIIAEMGEAVARTIAETHVTRQDALDEIHRRGGKARLQIEELEDPLTKRTFTVDSGSSYYWIDDRGNVVGTQTDSRPSVDFRELTRLP